MQVRLPNFVCVGAGKSGTTSLYEYLRQHKDVFLPKQKELHYFAWKDLEHLNKGIGVTASRADWCKSLSQYNAHFKGATNETIVGDISPSYLHCKNAPAAIRELLGNVKILIMLRNPTDKVISQHMHLKRDAREPLSLEAALDAEEGRVRDGWAAMYHYTKTSLYCDDVTRYVEVFGKDNVCIVLFEEFINDPQAALGQIYKFLKIDDSQSVSTEKVFNRSGLPKSKIIARLSGPNPLTTLAKRLLPRRVGVKIKRLILNINTGERAQVAPATRARLAELFRADVMDLEKVIGRSTNWNS